MRKISISISHETIKRKFDIFQLFSPKQVKHLPTFISEKIKSAEHTKTDFIALTKFYYNCWDAQKTFPPIDKNKERGFRTALNEALANIPLDPTRKEGSKKESPRIQFNNKIKPFLSNHFYRTKEFQRQFPNENLNDKQKLALFFSEMGIYCEAAKKSTLSVASQKTIDQFLMAANSEKTVPDFWNRVSRQFCVAGDPALTKLQELIKTACVPFHPLETNLDTSLRQVNVIGNRLSLVLGAITEYFNDVLSYCWVGREVLEDALHMITPLSRASQGGKDNGIEDPVSAVKELRKKRKEFNFITRRFSFAADALMNAIDWIVDPFIHGQNFNKEQLKQFAEIFVEMPYSSRLWKDAYKKLISKFGELETVDKIKVIEAAKNRELKRKEVDPAIPNLILRTSTHQNSKDDQALTDITRDHDNYVGSRYRAKKMLRVEQFKGEVPAAINTFSENKNIYRSNKEKMDALLYKVSGDVRQALEDNFQEKNIPDDLKRRIELLERKVEKLVPSDCRQGVLKFLIDQGNLAFDLKMKREDALSYAEGQDFYNTLLHGLTITLSAARIISSGMVARRNPKTYVAGTIVRFAGEVIPIPILSAIVTKLGDGIEFLGEYSVARKAEILSQLTNTNSELELLAEKITLGLAAALRDKLVLYTRDSVAKIAEYCKERFKALHLESAAGINPNNLDAMAEQYIAKIIEPHESEEIGEAIQDYFTYKLEPKVNLNVKPPRSIKELWKFQVPSNLRAAGKNPKEKEELSEDFSPSKGAYLPLTIRNLDRSSSVQGQHINDIVDVMDTQANRLRELEDRMASVAEIAHIQAIQTDELEKLIQAQHLKILELKHEIISAQLNELKHAKQMIQSHSPERSPEPTPFNTPVKNAAPAHLPLSPYAQRLIGNPESATEEEMLRKLKNEKRALKNNDVGIQVEIYAEQKRSTLPPYKRTDSIAKRISQEQYAEASAVEEIRTQAKIKKLHAYSGLDEFLSVQKRFSTGLTLLADTFETNREKIKSFLDAQNFEYVMEIIKQIREACSNPFDVLEEKVDEENFDMVLRRIYDIFSSNHFQKCSGTFVSISREVAILNSILGDASTKEEIKKLLGEQKAADDYFMTIIQHFPRIELLCKDLQRSCKKEFEGDLKLQKRIATIEKISDLASTISQKINENVDAALVKENNQRGSVKAAALKKPALVQTKSRLSLFSPRSAEAKNVEAASRRRALSFSAGASE